MNKKSEIGLKKIIKFVTPSFIRLLAKRIYWAIIRSYNKKKYIKKKDIPNSDTGSDFHELHHI